MRKLDLKRRHRAIKKAEEYLISHYLNRPQYLVDTNIQIDVFHPSMKHETEILEMLGRSKR